MTWRQRRESRIYATRAIIGAGSGAAPSPATIALLLKSELLLWPSYHLRSKNAALATPTGKDAQFAVDVQRRVERVPTGKQLGIDMGLKVFLTDSEGNTVDNPRHLRKAEMKLRRLHRRLSRTKKKSANRRKARRKLARAYLRVQRQREDFARKTASTLITSGEVIAYEHLQIANLMKNRRLAKAISDASWGRFLWWLKYYGQIYDIPVIAVEPAFTSQDCSACGRRVQKSLSVRTHVCLGCGLVLDRDQNAARNILAKACRTGGQSGTSTPLRVQNASGQTTATRRSVRTTSK
jgi:putative transposase